MVHERKKKGKTGIAANYLTRNEALKKLQVSLKNFRQLCILKGIYPRDPKKKRKGKNTTYYHKKDIQFLMHEPLLDKFRELKIFIRKYRKAVERKDMTKAKTLHQNQPQLVLDHLVKERYPSFLDAVRDMDDPLCMLFLFAHLPSGTSGQHSAEMAADCTKLSRHFLNYVFHAKVLRKVFVSIKGYYYQAEIMGQAVTWLVPHQFTQTLPTDVDYRVMVTFLQFYITLIRFLNFKLFHDHGLHYPPTTDEIKDARRAGLQLFKLERIKATAAKARSVTTAPVSKEAMALQAKVSAVVARLGEVADGDVEMVEEELDDLAKQPENKYASLWKGLTFLLSREVPQDALEFVLLCGGAQVLREANLTDEDMASPDITHQVVDRPNPPNRVQGREYVQPQWVFDSFNVCHALPTHPYAPGVAPPPHLSPFVDDEADGYVPRQRQILEEWVSGKKEALPAADVRALESLELASEERFARELQQEQQGVSYSQAQKEEAEGDAAEGDADEGNADEGDADEGEEEGDADEELGAFSRDPLELVQKMEEQESEERKLAKSMMTRKNKHMYRKMQYGIKKKEQANQLLLAKRQRIEAQESAPKKSKAAPPTSENTKQSKRSVKR